VSASAVLHKERAIFVVVVRQTFVSIPLTRS